jgi:DNA invertase Pin-like site-specific DNA recombinase
MAVTTRRVVREIPRAAILHVDAKEVLRMVVVAYARVSTEKEEQEDSFERQVSYYTALINSKPEWKFGGIYADPGITGTRAEKRPDFLRMIEDCRAGKINKILVKSISRFARNTVDALNYIRELKELGISIYFENENIDTLTPGGEVLITILAAMAEQESRTMSTNIKWSYQKKFKNGEVILNTGLMMGYINTGRKDDEGKVIYAINEEEAEIVRRICSFFFCSSIRAFFNASFF